MNDASLISDVFPLLALFVLLVVGGAIVLRAVQKWMRKPRQEEPFGFTLNDLRTMRERGELTSTEFDAARERVIQLAKRRAERDVAKAQDKGKRQNSKAS